MADELSDNDVGLLSDDDVGVSNDQPTTPNPTLMSDKDVGLLSDDQVGLGPEAESRPKQIGRTLLHSIIPTAGGLAAAGAGAEAGAAIGTAAGPIGTAVGGIIGGIGGAMLGGAAGDSVDHSTLGAFFDDDAQRAANRAANPYTDIATQLAAGAATMSPAAGASALERLAGAGIMGGLDAGQQLYSTGKVDPAEAGASAAMGAAMPRFNRLGEAIASPGARLVQKVAGRPNQAANAPTAPAQDDAAASQQATVAGETATEQQAPTAEGTTTGNPQSAPERSERVYGKGQNPADYQNDMLSTGQFAPDVEAALRQSTNEGAVGDYSGEERPAIPQPEPTRDIDQSLKEAPVDTGFPKQPVEPNQAPAHPAQLPTPDDLNEAPVPNPEVAPETQEAPAAKTEKVSEPLSDKDVGLAADVHPDVEKVVEAAKAADRNPTPDQIEANNQTKGHSRLFGKQISIENEKGSLRKSKPGSEPPWEVEMPYHYGDIKGTKGADGDNVDIGIIGNGDKHFIIDQRNTQNGKFDEHKVMAYAKDIHDAVDHYYRGFSDDRGPERLGGIKEVSADDLKKWLAQPGKKTKPYDPSFKDAVAAGPTEGAKPEPKVVTATVTKMKENGVPQDKIDAFRALNVGDQLKAGQQYLRDFKSKGTTGREDRMPSAAPKVEGLSVTAKDKASAEGKSRNIKALTDAFEATKPPKQPEPGANGGPAMERESKQDTIDRARKFLDAAKGANFRMKGANRDYRPSADNHAPTQLERAAKKLLMAKNPSDKAVDAFRAQELLLRSGREEDVATARATGRIDSDIGLSRRSGDAAIADAEAQQAKVFETPHEEAESMVEPEEATTPADVKRLSPKDGSLDITKPKDRIKLNEDTAKLVDNLVKAERKAPEGGSENKKASDGKKIALDSVDMKRIMEEMKKAEAKNASDKRGRVSLEELGKAAPEPPERRDLAGFVLDEKGSLNFHKINADFRNAILPLLKYRLKMFGTPFKDSHRRYDATIAQSNSNYNAKQAEKTRLLFNGEDAKHLGQIQPVLDGRYYQWLDKTTPAEQLTYMKTIEDPALKAKADVKQALLKAGISHNKVDWMADEAMFHRDLMDQVWQNDQLHGMNEAYVQNYVPHIFKDDKVDGLSAEQWLEQRVKNLGPTWYQKERVFDLLQAAIKAGFVPKYKNPIDLLNARLDASLRGHHLIDTAKALNKQGAAFNLSDLPPGYEKIGDAWKFQRRLPDGNTWAFAPDAEHLWTNGVEPVGLQENQGTPGSLFRTWMGWKRLAVPVQLSLSAFHATHVIMNVAVVQNLENAWRLSRANGEWTKNYTEAAKNFAKDTVFALPMMLPGINSLVRNKSMFESYPGLRMQKVWQTPDSQLSPHDLMEKQLFKEAGQSPYQAQEDVIGAKQKFAAALADYRNATKKLSPGLRVAARAVQRGMEKMQEPLFRDVIPALKNEAIRRSIARVLTEQPGLVTAPDQRKVALRQMGKNIDDRFGEMFYKNLFWNKTLKDAGVASFLSLSWNLGQARQASGALTQLRDIAMDKINPDRVAQRQPIEAARRAAEDKLAYVTHYVGFSMATAGALSYALSGVMPSGVDWLYPRNGHTNPEDGSPGRVGVPFNTREGLMLKAHADEKNSWIGGLAQLVYNKTMLQPVVDLARNKDFFNRPLYDTNAPWWKATLQGLDSTLGKMFNPISITGAQRAKELGGGARDQALSYLGFGPAPQYVNESPLDRRIGALSRGNAPGERPYEYSKQHNIGHGLFQDILKAYLGDNTKSDDIRNARKDLAAGDPGARKELIDAGLNKRTAKGAEPGDKFTTGFGRLPPPTQEALLPKMTDDDFNKYVWQNHHVSRERKAALKTLYETKP